MFPRVYILLANGDLVPVTNPTQIRASGLSWLEGANSSDHLCVVESSGTLSCPQYDLSSAAFSPTATQSIPGPLIDASIGSGHVCALVGATAADSQVFCYGNNEYGQLGTGDLNPSQAPIELQITRINRLFLGESGTYAVAADDQVYFWGGIYLRSQVHSTPTLLSWLTNVVQIDAFSRVRACAVQKSGTVLCWPSADFSVAGP